MNILKNNWHIIILAIILVLLDIYFREPLYSILLTYGLFIKFLLSEFVVGKVRKFLSIVVWSALALVLGAGYYVGHYFPHGPSYPTGDIVCRNDDKGPCFEEYREDLSKLDIPNWAKFFRGSGGDLLLLALLFAGILTGNKDNISVE